MARNETHLFVWWFVIDEERRFVQRVRKMRFRLTAAAVLYFRVEDLDLASKCERVTLAGDADALL